MIGHCHCLIGEKVEEKRKVNLATALEIVGFMITLCLDGDEADEKNES